MLHNEMRTKKVRDVLSRLYPQHTLYPKRRDGVVAARYKPVVKRSVRQDCATFLFNETALR